MATHNISYQGSGTSITITLTSLADGSWRQSAEVDNGTNKYVDALVGLSVQVGAVAAEGIIDVYAYGSWDNGTSYTGGVGNTDQAITWGTTGNTSVLGYRQLALLSSIVVDGTDDNNDIYAGPWSIAAAFNGIMPENWGIVIQNNTGAALNATGTNNDLSYTGIENDIV